MQHKPTISPQSSSHSCSNFSLKPKPFFLSRSQYMEMNSMSIDGCSQSQSQSQQAAASATSRWNPTKEQINMLEGLYKQGVRTPSAEQIQQITSKLKVYGHIEGKNVFYWFQNHKARQRQKQKQETNLLYFNRFLHKPTTTTVVTPVFIPPTISPPPSPCNNNNVICNQFYIPPPSSQANTGYYHHLQYPINKVPLPAAVGVMKRRSSRTGVMMMMERKLETSSTACGEGFYPAHNNRMVQQPDAMQGLGGGGGRGDVNKDNNINTPPPFKNSSSRDRNQTLELFPVHPTGVLNDHHQPNEEDDSRPCSSPFAGERNDDDHQQPFFDFFAGQQQH